MQSKREKRHLTEMMNVLRECLSIDPEERPDFIDLFKRKMLKTKDPEKIMLHILVEDNKLRMHHYDIEEMKTRETASFQINVILIYV